MPETFPKCMKEEGEGKWGLFNSQAWRRERADILGFATRVLWNLSVHHIGPVLTAILPFCVLILALICALIVFAEWSSKGPLTQNGPIRVPSLEFRIGTQKERELEASLYRFLTRELEGGHMFYHVSGEQREPDHRKQEWCRCAKKSWDEKQGEMGDRKYYLNFYPSQFLVPEALLHCCLWVL